MRLLLVSDVCLLLRAIESSAVSTIIVNPVAASNMKSVQFRQSLNRPVGLTYISFAQIAAVPDFFVHFLPMSLRLSPKTTTVCRRNGDCVLVCAVVVVVLGIASLSITGSSRVPPG